MSQFNISERFQNFSSDVVQQYVEPLPLRCTRLTLFAIVLLGSLIGNGVVIRTVLQANGVKSFTYLLICNLALAEIISACCLPFMQAYSELLYWPFPQALCTLVIPLQMTAGMVITTCIASIAFVRCLLLVRQRWYNMTRRKPVALLLSLAIWIMTFIFVLPFYLYMRKVPVGQTKHWCLMVLPGESVDSNYPSDRLRFLMIIQFVVNYAVPLGIVLVCYGIVVSKMKYKGRVLVSRNFKVQDITEAALSKSAETEISRISHKYQPDPKSHRQKKRNQPKPQNDDDLNAYEPDLLQKFYAIVLIFQFCYLPYQCFFMLEYMGKLSWNNWKYFDVTRTYLFLLTCFPSALHPICYGLSSRFYKKAFTKLILCKC